MSHPLKIEDPNATFLITMRTMNGRMWFLNNKEVEEQILAYLAKYQERYNVILYGFILMGNHYHLIARFPDSNKANFLRDFNAVIANLIRNNVDRYEEGRIWKRRGLDQILPLPIDIEHWMIDVALNPVRSGLVDSISSYTAYNSFFDAVWEKRQEFKIIDWTDYNNRKRYNGSLTIEDCTSSYTLKFGRIPTHEFRLPIDYRRHMLEKLKERMVQIVDKRKKMGKTFFGKERLREIIPGSLPVNSTKNAFQRRGAPVLSRNKQVKNHYLEKYLNVVEDYQEASRQYLSGNGEAGFPSGTYKPPGGSS